MKASIGDSLEKKWKPIALLSIIVPLSLLLAVRFAGIASQPLQPETTELETKTWNTQRPYGLLTIKKTVQQIYEDDAVSLNFSLRVESYYEDDSWLEEGDILNLYPFVGAKVHEGFIHSVTVRFSEIDDNALLDIFRNRDIGESRNMEIREIKDTVETRYPFIKAYGVNQPKDCLLMKQTYWIFLDTNSNYNHDVTVTPEVTYFDGKSYKKIVAPVRLEVFAYDDNDSFETAQEVALDSSYDWLFLSGKDREDNYKIWLNQGQQLNVALYPPSELYASADFDLYLIDRDKNVCANSTNREDGAVEEATVLSSYDGWWYIKVVRVSDCGYYSIVTKTKTP